MSGLIDDLIVLLKAQTENYSDLCGLLEEKKDTIVKNDTVHLQKITSIENTLVGKCQKLEKKLTQNFDDIAMVLNVNPKTLNLTELSKLIANQPEHTSLVEATGSLRLQVEKLKTVNEQNRLLLKNSLDYVDFSMNLFRSTVSRQPSFYSYKGEQIEATANNFFDAKQ